MFLSGLYIIDDNISVDHNTLSVNIIYIKYATEPARVDFFIEKNQGKQGTFSGVTGAPGSSTRRKKGVPASKLVKICSSKPRLAIK